MKQFLATLAGIVTGIAVIFGVEALGHQLTDFKISATSFEEFRKAMLNIPASVIIPVAIAHSTGALAGLIVSRLIERSTKTPMFYIAGLFIIFTIVNLLSLPHPSWFWLLDLGLILAVTFTYILTRKKS